MIICLNCNTENPDNAKFCQECGSKLGEDEFPECLEENELPDCLVEEIVPDSRDDNTPDCPACNQGSLSESTRKGALGIGTKHIYECDHCGAIFEKSGGKYKLTHIQDLDNPVWRKYKNKPLTFEEWTRIANGGISDAEQRRLDKEEKKRKIAEEKEQKKLAEERKKKALKEAEALKERDINNFLNNLTSGQVNLTSSTGSPMILKKNEIVSLVMPNVSFLEARSVRQTIGGYGGPSFRVAKGVSFRLGGVSARSVSHEELKKIDQGTLVLTNKRLTFLGNMRTVNIDLKKIVAIEPYKDGIGSQRENKQKTEYFTGTQKTSLNFSTDGRRTSIPVNGVVLRAAVMGNISKLV